MGKDNQGKSKQQHGIGKPRIRSRIPRRFTIGVN